MELLASVLGGSWMAPAASLVGRLDGPWTLGRVAKLVGTTAAAGGGAAGLFMLYGKLSAVPPTAPAAFRAFLEGACVDYAWLTVAEAQQAAAVLEVDAAFREACDRALAFAAFDRPAFCKVLLACAEVARLSCALQCGVVPYDLAAPQLMGMRVSNVIAALERFRNAVAPGALEDFGEVSAEIATAASWMHTGTQLQVRVELEKRALASQA